MKKFLKFLVITLGIIIIVLFIFTIIALISKYKNHIYDSNNISTLNIQINKSFRISSVDIDKNKLYINLEDTLTNDFLVRVYSLNDGTLLNEINLKKVENAK